MIHVINAELKNEYNVYVEFNNGGKGIINFKDILENDHREIIKELLNKELFQKINVS